MAAGSVVWVLRALTIDRRRREAGRTRLVGAIVGEARGYMLAMQEQAVTCACLRWREMGGIYIVLIYSFTHFFLVVVKLGAANGRHVILRVGKIRLLRLSGDNGGGCCYFWMFH